MVHVVQLVAEPPLLMVPAGHVVHVPLALVMLPGGQGLQPRDPLRSVLPATLSHGLQSVAPALSWYSPSGHGVQPVAPAIALLAFVPGRHLVHAPACCSEYKPVLHSTWIPAEH